ncbi:uncharacterized protein LOC128728387 [Anopheles nili]|uniref:uncharacterized protein LOC128728387 n=1 Tax=Anopheles nili TaxID=185578 RepID=UPI00237B260D|nr:uncharacterized protein LOC128728387 [Anopheles nili]
MENESLPILLVTANVGSVFEDPSNLLHLWIREFLNHVAERQPAFLALHLQEVGGKTYEKSMEYVQEFIKQLCESEELCNYNRIRVYLDEDYNSAEHFTALGNLYFVHSSINYVSMWNFLTHEWDSVEGKNIHTGSIETVATKEKAKFPQQFFPECKWSRKGFLRTRWFLNGTVFDLVNIHLFHDASNLEACEEYPSVYCKSRRRALVHTLERFHKDTVNRPVPYFVFGDFNFRCDTEGVIKKLTEDLTMHRVHNTKNDSTKVQYRDSAGSNVLTVGKKEFFHCDQSTFKENWLRQFDRELDSLRSILYEYPITFPPSYPFEEDPSQPDAYMATRCPAWCDRILISPAARKLISDERAFAGTGLSNNQSDKNPGAVIAVNYGIIGENVCMGDHKPVFLSIKIKTSQGILDNCCCDTHAPTTLRVDHPIHNNSTSSDSSSNNRTIVVSLDGSFGSCESDERTEVCIRARAAGHGRQLASIAVDCRRENDKSTSATIIPIPSIDEDGNVTCYHQLHHPSACLGCLGNIEQILNDSIKPSLPKKNQNLQQMQQDVVECNDRSSLPSMVCSPAARFNDHQPLVSINVYDTDSNLNVCMCALYNETKNHNKSAAGNDTGFIDDANVPTTKICPNCRNIIKHQPVQHRKTLISRRMMLANDVVVNRIDTHYLNTYAVSLAGQGGNGGTGQHHFEPYTPESAESHSPLPESYDIPNKTIQTINSNNNQEVDASGQVVLVELGQDVAASMFVVADEPFELDIVHRSNERLMVEQTDSSVTPSSKDLSNAIAETPGASTAGVNLLPPSSSSIRQNSGCQDSGFVGGVSPKQLKSRLEKLKQLADERRKKYGEWTRSLSQSDTCKSVHSSSGTLIVPILSVNGESDVAGPREMAVGTTSRGTMAIAANSRPHTREPTDQVAATITMSRESVLVSCCRGMCAIL